MKGALRPCLPCPLLSAHRCHSVPLSHPLLQPRLPTPLCPCSSACPRPPPRCAARTLLVVRQHDEILDPGHLLVLSGQAPVGSDIPLEWVVLLAGQATWGSEKQGQGGDSALNVPLLCSVAAQSGRTLTVVEDGYKCIPDEATPAAIPTAATVEQFWCKKGQCGCQAPGPHPSPGSSLINLHPAIPCTETSTD